LIKSRRALSAFITIQLQNSYNPTDKDLEYGYGRRTRKKRKRQLRKEDLCSLSANKITQYGKVVYSVFWDSGAPGAGADCELIFKWRERYAARFSWDEIKGPYGSLPEAIKETRLNSITSATVSIDSQELSSQQIVDMLKYKEDRTISLEINGETWLITTTDKKFVKKLEDDEE
jgi:hypothetical protein